MEKIKINKGKTEYEIEGIRLISERVLQIIFADKVPAKYGDIAVYTAGGLQCANLPGFSTLYRDEGQTVYLSDNGSVYTIPETATETDTSSAPFVPTEEELLAAAVASKKAEISAACEAAIYSGVNVTLSDGSTEHFALSEHDQINLFAKQMQLSAGADQLEYHSDGNPCRYYSAADMQAIIAAAMFWVSYHTTYCNALNMWLARCQTAEEVQQIYYGADVPEEYQSEVLKAYLIQIATGEGDVDDAQVDK